MVSPDHLIFGINSNVMVNGTTKERRDEANEREQKKQNEEEHKFQFLPFAWMSQIHSCYLNLILSLLSTSPLHLPSWKKAHVEHFKIIYANVHYSP